MISIIKNKVHNLISDKKFSEILAGSVWALGAKVIATVLGMASSIIVARAYGAEVLGIVAVLNSFLMLATIFTVLGTNTSILRLIPEHIAKYSPTSAFKVYRKIQYFVAAVSVVTGTLLYFGSGFIAETVFSKPHLRFYFALGAVFIIFNTLMILNTQAVRGLRLIRVFAFMQLLPSLSKLIILIPITIFFYHQSNPIYAMFASIAITALAGAWIMDRVFKQKSAPTDTLHHMPMKDILTISMPMLMTATMTFIIGQTGVIMLGMFRPEAEVGYYAVAVKLATLVVFFISAINSMSASKFSELYYGDKNEELFYIAKKSAKLIFWTTTPILMFLVIFGKYIITFLFGEDFQVAYLPMCFLALGQFITSITGSTGTFMNMTGSHKSFLYIKFITMVINVALSMVLIPKYGMYGAGISAMISMVFLNISSLIYIKIKYNFFICHLPFFNKI